MHFPWEHTEKWGIHCSVNSHGTFNCRFSGMKAKYKNGWKTFYFEIIFFQYYNKKKQSNNMQKHYLADVFMCFQVLNISF